MIDGEKEHMLHIEVSAEPDENTLTVLAKELAGFNAQIFGEAGRQSLAVFMRDDNGKLVAGLNGFTAWGWLYTQWLWIDESQRGQGLAQQLLDIAETEAKKRGCIGAHIDTFSPIAQRAYEKAGYVVFGEIVDFPIGHKRIYLQKKIM